MQLSGVTCYLETLFRIPAFEVEAGLNLSPRKISYCLLYKKEGLPLLRILPTDRSLVIRALGLSFTGL
jgi:hypothetical protein